MSDSTITPAQDDSAQGVPDVTEQQGEQNGQAEQIDWKAEARKWENRAKENKSAAEKLAELEQAQMTEAEKAEARIKAAEERAAELEAANARKDVALKHGLSADDAALLEGMTDPEAMERLAERLAQQARDSTAPRTPKPHPAQRAGDAPAEDKDAIARAFFGI